MKHIIVHPRMSTKKNGHTQNEKNDTNYWHLKSILYKVHNNTKKNPFPFINSAIAIPC